MAAINCPHRRTHLQCSTAPPILRLSMMTRHNQSPEMSSLITNLKLPSCHIGSNRDRKLGGRWFVSVLSNPWTGTDHDRHVPITLRLSTQLTPVVCRSPHMAVLAVVAFAVVAWLAHVDAAVVTCAVGTKLVSGVCVNCAAGTFNSAVGANVCTNCPAGTYAASSGATSVAACTNCPAGTYSVFGSPCTSLIVHA